MRHSQRFSKSIIYFDGLFNKTVYNINFFLSLHYALLDPFTTQFNQHSHMICGLKMQLLLRVDSITGYVEMSSKMQFGL